MVLRVGHEVVGVIVVEEKRADCFTLIVFFLSCSCIVDVLRFFLVMMWVGHEVVGVLSSFAIVVEEKRAG